MRVFILRHGIAAPPSPGKSDESRALTLVGKKRMRRAALGMKALGLKFDRVFSSPLIRCRQTAAAVVEALGIASETTPTPVLSPETKSPDLLKLIAQLPATSAVLLVGHEPSLSGFASFLVTGRDRGLALELKKGGLCRIDFSGKPRGGGGTLVFHLPPRTLRGLRGKSKPSR